jgi:hypothetical protein
LFVGQFGNVEIGHVLRKNSKRILVNLYTLHALFALLDRFAIECDSKAHQLRSGHGGGGGCEAAWEEE